MVELHRNTNQKILIFSNEFCSFLYENPRYKFFINGKESFELEIPADRIEKMQLFLASDKPMAKNIEVAFAGKDVPLRHSEIELAIDELTEEWCDFEEVYDENPELTNIHPYYGQLNFDQWKRIHAKHFTHHFEQFGLM